MFCCTSWSWNVFSCSYHKVYPVTQHPNAYSLLQVHHNRETVDEAAKHGCLLRFCRKYYGYPSTFSALTKDLSVYWTTACVYLKSVYHIPNPDRCSIYLLLLISEFVTRFIFDTLFFNKYQLLIEGMEVFITKTYSAVFSY